jgi:hypothetical protein
VRLIEDSSGIAKDVAKIVQGRCDPSLYSNLPLSHYFLYVGYAVWSTRELVLLLPAKGSFF